MDVGAGDVPIEPFPLLKDNKSHTAENAELLIVGLLAESIVFAVDTTSFVSLWNI